VVGKSGISGNGIEAPRSKLLFVLVQRGQIVGCRRHFRFALALLIAALAAASMSLLMALVATQ
jgi:hypothetical protein